MYSDLWSLGITLLMATGSYQHLEELSTKTLKSICGSKAFSKQQTEEYILGLIARMEIPDNGVGLLIRRLLQDLREEQ